MMKAERMPSLLICSLEESRMKKRLFALLLAICLLLCAAVPALAASGDETVAKLYLGHRWSDPPSLGHVCG